MKIKNILTICLSIILISCNNDKFVFEGFKEEKSNDIIEVYTENDLLGKYVYTTTKYLQDSTYFELNEDKTFILHLQGITTGNWSFNEDKTRINISNLDLCSFLKSNIEGHEDLIPTYVDFDLTYGYISLTLDSFKYVFKPRKLQELYGVYKFYYSIEDYYYTVNRDIEESILLKNNNEAIVNLCMLKDDSIVEYELKTYTGTWQIEANTIIINYNDTSITYTILNDNELAYNTISNTQYILKKQ